jgi:hypothetical protein
MIESIFEGFCFFFFFFSLPSAISHTAGRGLSSARPESVLQQGVAEDQRTVRRRAEWHGE